MERTIDARIADLCTGIAERIYTPVTDFIIEAWISSEPLRFDERKNGRYRRLSCGERWGAQLFDCSWFHFTAQVPDDSLSEDLFAVLDVNGEMIVVDETGEPLTGLTNQASHYDFSLGKPGKIVYPIPGSVGPNISIWADAGFNDLFGRISENGVISKAHIAVRDEGLRDLYYDLCFLREYIQVLEEDSELRRNLTASLLELGETPPTRGEEAESVHNRLSGYFHRSRAVDPLTISAVGHAHIDLAWLWPIRETIRKGVRTFATALMNLDTYPDYIFGASQPQLYQWVKDNYSRLFDRIKKSVAEGRWELQGAFWVECDTNLVGGESLVRQLLYGKRFYREEFGIDVRSGWLPDVFGFSGALPQIMKQFGIDYFVTMKPAWNRVNIMPHHSFMWQGIDGSCIPTHIVPEGTYNSAATPASIHKLECRYLDREFSDAALMLFGIGDGGGGPGASHLESLTRMTGQAGLPPVVQESSRSFYERWIKDSAAFPTWSGEIYLERHQGTYTTNSKIKKYNIETEKALRNCELIVSFLCILGLKAYPTERLETFWKTALLLQFHDILPGSSIKRVYDEAYDDYDSLLGGVRKIMRESFDQFRDNIATVGMSEPYVVVNTTSFNREEWVKLGETWAKVNIGPMGFSTIDRAGLSIERFHVHADDGILENDLVILRIDENGMFSNLLLKRSGKELISGRANELTVYCDEGNAWDFQQGYRDSIIGHPRLISTRFYTDGPVACAELAFEIEQSSIEQRIRLCEGSTRIDIDMKICWYDEKRMVRTAFNTPVHAYSARYGIQFGYVERATHTNTSWDVAREEVVGQQWVDLSQQDVGLSLLNDGKYGHCIRGNRIELCLLRSVPYPNIQFSERSNLSVECRYTDIGVQQFTYSLYPHAGNSVLPVVREAWRLNHPLPIHALEPNNRGSIGRSLNAFSVSDEEIVIQTIKKAEDNDMIVLRLYEAVGGTRNIVLKSSFQPIQAWECDLEETRHRELVIEESSIGLLFKPFEIKTICIQF